MKRRIVRHPDNIRGALLTPSGRGGPDPGAGLGPVHPINPVGPGSPPANATGSVANQAAAVVEQQLGASVQAAAKSIIAPGEILIGVVLIAVGLLLATGQGRTVAKAGLFAATRGLVK